MRRPREIKEATHTAIVAHASRLFRERGVEGTSVGDVMAQAGLTHGGFYRHFETKEALAAAAIRETFAGIGKAVEERAASVGIAQAVADYLAYYLSDDHLTHPGLGCPAPSLGGEIGRAPGTLKAEFGASLNRTLTLLAQGFPGAEAESRAEATRAFALRVGAILLARASDDATAREIVDACRVSESAPPATRTRRREAKSRR